MNRLLRNIARNRQLCAQIKRAFGSSQAKLAGLQFGDHGRCSTFNFNINGDSANYLDSKYEDFVKDPDSVEPSFRKLFAEVSRENPSAVSDNTHSIIKQLISTYQNDGHHRAKLDPLGCTQATSDPSTLTELDSLVKKLEDMDRPVLIPNNTYIGGTTESLTPREIILRMENAYCQKIGAEFNYLKNSEEIDWIKRKLEVERCTFLDENQKKWILKKLIAALTFEEFLQAKYPAEKRFSIEGGEALVPCVEMIFEKTSQHGGDSIVMGMSHRGRLNVLSNVFGMPMKEICALFAGKVEIPDGMSGDVKYHMGFNCEREMAGTGKKMKLIMLPNPSHLETVDPIVLGMVHAEQVERGDKRGEKVASVLIHGDAAFAGQGIVYETFQLSAVPGYSVGGTIHVVVNNQVGFTTDPQAYRSSIYCTDVAKVTKAPVFHVNADDPEAVVFVSSLAAEWRAKFHKDVVIDLICYRRRGHNEADEPAFTQPSMYQLIKKHRAVCKSYADDLMKDKVVDQKWVDDVQKSYRSTCDAALTESKDVTTFPSALRKDVSVKSQSNKSGATTGVDEDTLVKIGRALSSPPDGLSLHKKLHNVLGQRQTLCEERRVDWALGEAFAFGSLLKEGVRVRLSGQDVERGTFSHRHHILHDQQRQGHHVSVLNRVFPNQAEYSIYNSILSEYGVMGFELGYSLQNPRSLVCWEAQFGDFTNTAQSVIDQYLSSGEKKWGLQTRLVLLLPHGYEGMGPEHSSARMERFLQSCDDDEDVCPSLKELEDPDFAQNQLQQCNWQVMNLTTPANYFHALRRQVVLPVPKPMIVMTPKSLLRLKEAQSSFDEMLPGKELQRVIADSSMQEPGSVKKVLFCSGKVYYDLVKRREKEKLQQQVAIVRVEQLAPFPFDFVSSELKTFPNATVTWVQEEHKNMGAYSFVKPRMHALMKQMGNQRPEMRYAGRAPASSTATGNKNAHYRQEEQFLREAMSF